MNITHLNRHSGAALITALIILLVLTVLGVTAMRNTSLQENITGNLRDHDLALQAAESALTNAENMLNGAKSAGLVPLAGGPLVVSGNTVGTVFAANAFPPMNNTGHDATVWDGKNNITSTTSLAGVPTPSYIIQFEGVGPCSPTPDCVKKGQAPYYYRITARGLGISSNSVALLQEIYGIKP